MSRHSIRSISTILFIFLSVLSQACTLLQFCEPLLAQDNEITNYKSGISVLWGGVKGSAYQEEYFYHDKLISDSKSVFIRDSTAIAMTHNERNVGTLSGRTKVVIGADGGGQIRYQIDKMWNEQQFWAHPTNAKKSAYTAPFTLGSQFYEAGVPVVGTTGGRPQTSQQSASFYWRGMLDSVGDEWHVLMYADDDQSLGSLYDDSWASDGKTVLLVVNPKTPALTVRATGNAQFYTTPAWTYWTNKIHDQTTYIYPDAGSLSFEIRDIYGNNIHYRINGGAYVDAGAPSVTLTQNHFNDGVNTLQYYYQGNQGYVRTRTVVKNPIHPGLSENHGDRVWGGASAWAKFRERAARPPYATRVSTAQSTNATGQAEWDAKKRQGLRFGGANWPHLAPPTSTNALLAKYLGFDARRTGAIASYAHYAKEMLLESPLNQSPLGYEADFWASYAIPAADIVYRGYWDVNPVISAAITYDVLMGGYRSDQLAGGITPIEDYFLRDQLASWVHLCSLQLGGFVSRTDTGMWSTSRAVGASLIAVVMPSYSTKYYGTSGVDGATQVHADAPFQGANYTWKDLYIDHDYTIGVYPQDPILPFGLEGSVESGALIRPPGTQAVWVDKTDYASYGQCGHNIYLYANIQALYGNLNSHPYLLNYLDQITKGSLYGGKGDTVTPLRQHAITVLNRNFPQAAANAAAWVKSLPASDQNSDDQALADAGLLGIFFYDDTYYGEPVTSATPPAAPIGLKIVD